MGYRELLWGLIFLFDFRFGNIDILPDTLGYFLFYRGLNYLSECNQFYDKARVMSVFLIIISIPDMFMKPVTYNNNLLDVVDQYALLYFCVVSILSILLVYFICEGIKTEARRIQDFEVEQKTRSRWLLYLITNILILLHFMLPSFFQGLILLTSIGSIISFLLMLGLMRSAELAFE